jgi:hypothetical protein
VSPNERLRAARERVESPSAPGEPMTRQELADAINAHIYRVSGGTQVTAVDPNHVGKWERGVIRWPAARYREALRAILDVDSDRNLGFARPSRGKPQDVDRKTFLKTALGASVGATLTGYTPAVAGGGSADVLAALSGPTAHYWHMEQAVSSERLAPAVDAHLVLATDIVRGQLRTGTGFSVLAEIWPRGMARRRPGEQRGRARWRLRRCGSAASTGASGSPHGFGSSARASPPAPTRPGTSTRR